MDQRKVNMLAREYCDDIKRKNKPIILSHRILIFIFSFTFFGHMCLRPSTVEGANEGANTLFDTIDALFGTVDREDVGNEEGANLLLLPPLWSA